MLPSVWPGFDSRMLLASHTEGGLVAILYNFEVLPVCMPGAASDLTLEGMKCHTLAALRVHAYYM